MNILICFEDIEDLPVREMGDSGEADVPAVGEEEWNLVDKEDVSRKVNFLVEFEDGWRDLEVVSGDWFRCGPGGLALEGSNVGSPNSLSQFDISEGHWTVLDGVTLDYPFVVSHGGVGKLGIQISSLLCSLDLSLGETSLIPFHSGEESEVGGSIGVIVVKTAWMHVEDHVGHPIGFLPVHNET